MTKVPVEAAGTGILSRLVELFFKGMDKILDSAIEYQNDNGILKGTTSIPVRSADNTETVFHIELAPVDGNGSVREGTFVVSFSCDDISDINTTVNGVDYQNSALVLNKETLPTFENIVNQILDANSLQRIEDTVKDEDTGTEIKKIPAYDVNDKSEDPPTILVTVQALKVQDRDIYRLEINADRDVKKKFTPKQVSADEIPGIVGKYFTDNELEATKQEDYDWMYSDNAVTSSKKVNLTLKKSITANEEVIDLVKVHASYDIQDALVAIDSVLDSDDFLKGLKEGETDLVIIDEGEDLDISESDSCVDPIQVAMELLGYSKAFEEAMYRLNLAITGYEPTTNQINCFDYAYWTHELMNSIGQYLVRQTNEVPVIPSNVAILPSITLTPQSSFIDKLRFDLEVCQYYADILSSYAINIDYEPFLHNADSLLCQLQDKIFRLSNAINSGDYGSAVTGQPLVIQQELNPTN